MSRVTVWGIIALICATVVFIDVLVFGLRPPMFISDIIFVMNASLAFLLIVATIVDTMTTPIEREKTDIYDEILLWSGVIDALLKEEEVDKK